MKDLGARQARGLSVGAPARARERRGARSCACVRVGEPHGAYAHARRTRGDCAALCVFNNDSTSTAKQQNTAYYAYSTQTRTTSLNRLAQAAWAWRRPVTTTRVDGTQCTLAAAASGRTRTQGRCRAYTVVP